jgi:hypothetical protein
LNNNNDDDDGDDDGLRPTSWENNEQGKERGADEEKTK